MEKNNNRSLYAILGGVVACFICIGMVFLYPSKGNVNLKGNSFGTGGNLLNDTVNNEEIVLGDTCSAWSYGTWKEGTWGSWICSPGGSTTGTPADSLNRATYTQYDNIDNTQGCAMQANLSNCNACHRERNWTRPATCTAYSACDAGKYLNDGKCTTCPKGAYCPGDKDVAHFCPAGTYNPSTGKGSIEDCLQCTGEKEYSEMGAIACSNCGEDNANATHTSCEHTTSSGCSPGEWRGEHNCEQCPAGYYCPDGIKKIKCDGNTINTVISQSHCVGVCAGAQVPNSDHTACVKCTGNQVPNADNSLCVSCGPNQVANSSNTACITATPTPKVVTCTEPNTYYDGEKCKTCPDGYKATPENPNCHIEIAAGSYLVTSGQSEVNACPANTYSTGGTHNLTGTNTDSVVGLESCKTCKSLYPDKPISSLGSGPDGCRADDGGTCTLTVTSNAQIVSPKSDRMEMPSSYPDTFTVTVAASGSGCNKAILSMSTDGKSARNAADAGKTYTISDGFTIHILHHATIDQCTTTTVTATAKKSTGETVASGSTTVEIRKEWSFVGKYCESKASYDQWYHSYTEADANAGGKDPNHYATILSNTPDDECGNERKYNLYVRGCPTGSGSDPTPTPTTPVVTPTPTPTPTPTTPPDVTPTPTPPPGKIPYCYYDENDEPVWTDSPKASWKKVEGVTKKEDCKKEEEPACYIDLKGDYVWGKHAKDAGYQIITSIKNSEDCHKPTGEYACYKNTAGDYKWSKTPIDGYEKVPEAKTPAECSAPEAPACYVAPTGKYVWGKYNTIKGYIIMVGLSEKECVAPEKKACYIAPDGKYVWGDYGNNSKYKLVVSVTEEKQCINDVPTPKTDSNVSKLVYVFMAILMACGIGFIYYSSVLKKQNN